MASAILGSFAFEIQKRCIQKYNCINIYFTTPTWVYSSSNLRSSSSPSTAGTTGLLPPHARHLPHGMEDEQGAKDNRSDGTSHNRLFACYVLVSTAPRSRSASAPTYIGFTVNPSRRLGQHNGLVRYGGAYRTRRHRPWMTVAVIHGFTSKTSALQFEWAWQNPQRSLTLKTHKDRPDAQPLPTKKRNSVLGALQTLGALVSVPPWSHCALTLTICIQREQWGTYGIEQLTFPPHFRTAFAPLDSFENSLSVYSFRQPNDTVVPHTLPEGCPFCRTALGSARAQAGAARGECAAGERKLTYCASCGCTAHLACFGQSRSQTLLLPPAGDPPAESFLPTNVTCKQCDTTLHWSLVVRLANALLSGDD